MFDVKLLMVSLCSFMVGRRQNITPNFFYTNLNDYQSISNESKDG